MIYGVYGRPPFIHDYKDIGDILMLRQNEGSSKREQIMLSTFHNLEEESLAYWNYSN